MEDSNREELTQIVNADTAAGSAMITKFPRRGIRAGWITGKQDWNGIASAERSPSAGT